MVGRLGLRTSVVGVRDADGRGGGVVNVAEAVAVRMICASTGAITTTINTITGVVVVVVVLVVRRKPRAGLV